MPLYTYRCNACDYTFEVRQRMTDEPLTECPSCGKGEARRVINPVGVVFKGSGFYITDSRKGSSSNGSSAAASSARSSDQSKKETQADSSSSD